MRDHGRVGRLPIEGRAPRGAFVEDDAKAIQVASEVDFRAARLLGRHVLRRREQLIRVFDERIVWIDLAASDAKVEEFDDLLLGTQILGEEDVLGFDVAVDDPGGVNGVQSLQDLHGDLGELSKREDLVVLHPLEELLAVEDLHGDKTAPLLLDAVLVDTDDIFGGDLGAQERLALEAFEDIGVGGVFVAHHLERDRLPARPIVLEAFRGVDLAHTSCADEAEDAIVGEEITAVEYALEDVLVQPEPTGEVIR